MKSKVWSSNIIGGVGWVDWGMPLPSLPPLVAKSPVIGIECYVLIDTCGGSVPCLDKIVRMFRGPFSDDGRSVPIKRVAGRQTM